MKLNTSIQKPSNTKAPLHSLEFPDYDKQHYLDNMDKKYPGIECLMDGKKGVIIYGAGRMGKNFLRSLKQLNIPVTAFADTNPQLWGHPIDNVIIIPPDDIIKKYPSAPVLIASLTFESEIESKLRSMNVKYIYPLCYLNLKFPKIFISPEYEGQFNSLFDENNKTDILDAYNLWADDESKRVYKNLLEFRLTLDKHLIAQSRSDAPQYFESDIIQLSSEEVFLDCGAYTGDTIIQFCKETQRRFQKIYAFEPDKNNLHLLNKTIFHMDDARIQSIASGVYKTSGHVGFQAMGALDSRINPKDSQTVEVVSLDDFFKNKEVPTFIKMDIEGSEADALEGAKKLIEAHKPKLAIAVYHQASDLWRLPLLINALHNSYRLFLRHYTYEITDTVCYAL